MMIVVGVGEVRAGMLVMVVVVCVAIGGRQVVVVVAVNVRVRIGHVAVHVLQVVVGGQGERRGRMRTDQAALTMLTC